MAYEYKVGKPFPEIYLDEIRSYGLVPPTTNHGCHDMLVFISEGPYGTKVMRIKLLKDAEVWLGKRVWINTGYPDDEKVFYTVSFTTAASKEHWRMAKTRGAESFVVAMLRREGTNRTRYHQTSKLVEADER